jgi:hypothetical protein
MPAGYQHVPLRELLCRWTNWAGSSPRSRYCGRFKIKTSIEVGHSFTLIDIFLLILFPQKASTYHLRGNRRVFLSLPGSHDRRSLSCPATKSIALGAQTWPSLSCYCSNMALTVVTRSSSWRSFWAVRTSSITTRRSRASFLISGSKRRCTVDASDEFYRRKSLDFGSE